MKQPSWEDYADRKHGFKRHFCCNAKCRGDKQYVDESVPPEFERHSERMEAAKERNRT